MLDGFGCRARSRADCDTYLKVPLPCCVSTETNFRCTHSSVSSSAATGCSCWFTASHCASRALPRCTNVRSPSALTPTRYGASETIALFCAATLRPPSASKARPSTFEAVRATDEALQIEIELGDAVVVGHRGRELFLIRLGERSRRSGTDSRDSA